MASAVISVTVPGLAPPFDGSFALSKICRALPLNFVQAPGAGLAPRIRFHTCCCGFDQSISTSSNLHQLSYVAWASSWRIFGALPALTRSSASSIASTPIGNRRSK